MKEENKGENFVKTDDYNSKGVFLVSAKNVNTYSKISTVPRGSERS